MSSFHTAAEFVVSFGAATIAVLALNPLARRLGWVDRPHGRKDHEVATPVTGGLAISIGVLLALPLGMTVPDAFYAFCLGSLVLLVVGILDDLLDLSWSFRLLAQCGAALIMVYLGNVRAEYIGLPGDPASIDLGILTVPFTVFITIGIINAINMADGADGVAGGVTLVSLAMLGFVCERVGNYELLDRIVILAGAIAGFFVMNMRHPWQPRAQAFLGNSGSTIIGLAITWLTVRISHTAGHPVSSILGPWLVALPLIDCVVLMLRRVRQHRSPFSADRNHMHHLLLDAGFSPSQVALLLAGLTALFGMSAMAAIYVHVPQIVLVLVFLMLIGAHYVFTGDRDRAVRTLYRLRVGIRNLVMPVSTRSAEGIVPAGQYRPTDGSRAKL
jgi:UDP-GlcNAc:undecaprenyl-phosphate GlcNAc-1-phosphate transferase